MSVRVRFAPSPTGYLHVGGLRTALYNYIFAKQNNGKLILRIEDTDRKRFVNDAEEKLVSSLSNLGISFDEGPDIGGDYGPYKQSERLEIYISAVKDLIQNGYAYACKTENEIDSDDIYRQQSSADSLEIIEKNKFYVRLKIPDEGEICFTDMVRGDVSFNLELIEDPIILKSDGYPTYHLANVVDDHMMGITHVMRGEEWLSSMPKHLFLYQAFGWETPTFIHLPLLLNSDKSKLSKRQGDVHVDAYLDNGYLREVIVNFVALLGWHPSSDKEIFDIDDLINEFSIGRIQKAGAVFDRDKLGWMNRTYIKSMNIDMVVDSVKSELIKSKFDLSDSNKLSMAVSFAKDRVTTINEIANEIQPFYNDFVIKEEDSCHLKSESAKKLLKFWLDECNAISDWNSDSINNLLEQTQKKLGIKGKDLYFPLRTALYGSPKGPDIPLISLILGKSLTINRLGKQLS